MPHGGAPETFGAGGEGADIPIYGEIGNFNQREGQNALGYFMEVGYNIFPATSTVSFDPLPGGVSGNRKTTASDGLGITLGSLGSLYDPPLCAPTGNSTRGGEE